MKKSSKKSSKAILSVFLVAVIIISLVLMKKNSTDSVETVNTMTENMQTDVVSEELSDEEARSEYGHDIEYPDYSEAVTETAAVGIDEVVEEVSDDEAEEITEAESETEAVTTSRTVITSRQRKEYDSNSVYIDMENILQNPELPVGCEITALTILLRFYGFDAEKTDLARNYLPTSWGNARTVDGKLYKDSFFDYFIGDPFSKGYGCFSPAIETAANSYISSHGGGYTVKNISGCHPDTLYEYLIAGTPVLCWATDGMIEPEYYESWYDNATGEKLDWYLNEHCFVLAGFNIANSTVTLNDPMKGIIDYNIDKFEVRFKQMYSQAIVIIPDSADETEASDETAVVTEIIETEAVTDAVTEVVVPYDTETATDTSDMTEQENISETEYETESESETESQSTAESDFEAAWVAQT